MMGERNEKELNMIKNALTKLKGSAVLVDPRYNREWNLCDESERDKAMNMLKNDNQDRMEFYVSRREDMEIMIGLMDQLHHVSRQKAFQ